MYRLLVIVIAAVVLAGCGGQLPWQSKAEVNPTAEDDAKCQSYGFQPGTPDYEKCRQKLDDLRAQADAQDRAALAGRLQGRPPAWWNPSPTGQH